VQPLAVSLLARGTQRALARRFAVSESTISRDLVGILAERGPSRRCPFCGAKPLDDEGVRAIENGHERLRRRNVSFHAHPCSTQPSGYSNG
jgi:DeoR/GlpR family transcriptional regulator of sugar metabolism